MDDFSYNIPYAVEAILILDTKKTLCLTFMFHRCFDDDDDNHSECGKIANRLISIGYLLSSLFCRITP